MRWEVRKWDGSVHRVARAELVGSTDRGTWLLVSKGTRVRRPYGTDYPHPCDALTLLPREGIWHATWLLGWDPPVYVDIAQQIVGDSDDVVTVDLEIDVVRRADGSVEVLDLDEFESNRVRYDYPASLVHEALRASRRIASDLAAGNEPSGDVPQLPPGFEHLLSRR